MKRWATVTALAVAGLVAATVWSALPASAEGVEVTGTFQGPGGFDPDGSIFHTWHDITGTWPGLGEVSAHLSYDADLSVSASQPPLSNGAFTITTSNGTLTGG